MNKPGSGRVESHDMTPTQYTLPVAVALVAALVLSPGETHADVDAATVAARVQRFHDQTQSFQATFHQTYYHRLYGRYQRSGGRLRIEKPGRIRFDYARPNGKVIVTDGSTLTVYEPGDDGQAGQYLRRPADSDALPGAFSFLTGGARLADEFDFRLMRFGGFDGHVLEMTPKVPDPRYARVYLYVDSHPSRLGVVHAIRIDDHEGNRNKLELRNLRFNRSISDSVFAWRPPSGSRPIRM